MNEWISVKVRLPILESDMGDDNYKVVTVAATDGENVMYQDFQAGNTKGFWSSFSSYGYFRPENITHWQPMPKPPVRP